MRDHTLNHDAGLKKRGPVANRVCSLWAEGPRELRRAGEAHEQQDEELVARILGARTEEERVAAEASRRRLIDNKSETDFYEPSDTEIANSLF